MCVVFFLRNYIWLVQGLGNQLNREAKIIKIYENISISKCKCWNQTVILIYIRHSNENIGLFQVTWFIINVYSNFNSDITRGKLSKIEKSSMWSHKTNITEDNFYLNLGWYASFAHIKLIITMIPTYLGPRFKERVQSVCLHMSHVNPWCVMHLLGRPLEFGDTSLKLGDTPLPPHLGVERFQYLCGLSVIYNTQVLMWE